MLKTHQSRPIDKIQNLLNMLIEDYEFSLSELNTFLSKMIAEEKIETSDGITYSIRKW